MGTRVRAGRLFDRVRQDARFAFRVLRRAPTFAIVAVATLTLGIGANAAVVAVIDQVLIRPPAGVANPGQIRRLVQRFTAGLTHERRARTYFTYPEYDAVRRALPPAMRMAASAPTKVAVAEGSGAATLDGAYVFADYFGLLGVRAEAGRLFAPEEVGRAGPSQVAVISDAAWHSRFGARRDVTERSLTIDGLRYRIVGVAAPGFRGAALDAEDVWLPFNTAPMWRDTTQVNTARSLALQMLLRVGESDNIAAVQGMVTRTLAAVDLMGDGSAKAELTPISDLLDPQNNKATTAIMTRVFAAAIVILLIACANVAGLLLIRASERRQELTIRFALGGSRRRLVGQLAVESALLVAIAGACAFAAAAGAGSALRNLLLPNVTWSSGVIGWRLAIAVTVLVVGVGVAASLSGFGYVRERALATGLRVGQLDTGGRSIARSTLLVVQTGLSVVLLSAATVMLRSASRVEGIDVGYHADDVVMAWSGGNAMVDLDRTDPVLRAAASRLAETPGVRSVALTLMPPMLGIRSGSISIPGVDSVSLPPGVQVSSSGVTPDYFKAMGIRLLRGREFTTADRAGSELVAIVSATVARLYWPGRDALGQCMMFKRQGGPCRRVIGVVDDVHAFHLFENSWIQLYIPLDQDREPFDKAGVLIARAAPGAVRSLLPIVRNAVTSAGPGTSNGWNLQPFDDILAPELAPWRISAALFTALAILALTVGITGVYGAVSYTASRRTREIGVRRALGATGIDIVALVMSESMSVTAIGVLVGVGASLLSARLIATLIYGVSPRDPVSLAGAAMLLLAAATAACIAPARRATRVDPLIALSAE
jgi:predicted permease